MLEHKGIVSQFQSGKTNLQLHMRRLQLKKYVVNNYFNNVIVTF